jgi:DNA-binding CsgD family transcriptional regulator
MAERFKGQTNIQLVDEASYRRIIPYITALDEYSHTIYQSIYVVDYYKMNFLYVSKNPLFLCGYTSKEVESMGFNFYLSCVPQREHSLLRNINEVWFDFCNSLPVDERTLYTISCDFHLLHGKKEILVNHKLSPMLLSEDGKIWLAVCSVSLSAHSDEGHIDRRKKGSPEFWEYCMKRHKWEKMQDLLLTEREHAVLALSARGYTVKDIAEHLCLTEVTVKFHRNKLFMKLGVSNITEALCMAMNYKLI